jgi:hypothetical protein
MSTRIHRRLGLAVLLVAGLAPPVAAQLADNLGALTATNAKGYLAPLPDALSGTMNAAVFQSGRVPKRGFDFRLGVKVMGIAFSDDDKTYTPSDPPGFTSLAPVQAPTVIGSNLAVLQQGQGGTSLYHPGGFDIGEFALAVPQLSVGSVLGTRAVVRYIALDLGDSELGDFKLLGLGGQHSISQYLPGLPVDLAVGVFYQTFEIGDDLVKTSALHLDVTGSKRFRYLEPYVGVGFDRLDMDAKYESDATGETIEVNFDPVNSPHLTAGCALLLPVVKLHGELNLAATNGAAVGLSFGN